MSDHSDRVFMPNTETLSFYDSNTFNISNYNDLNSESSCLKETGIIEKMLSSYGFIQCCERQARLFFHFSQYLGNIDHLKIGDAVEYETSYDRRNGKPVAANIKKIDSNDIITKLSKTERLIGFIATELTDNREGRIAFENMGEFFFLPFNQQDVIDSINYKANDKVSFVLTTDVTGNYRATSVQLEAGNLEKYQGIVNAIKDTFGFIDRTDSITQIFFHSSDCVDFKSLNIGDLVQFNITTRKNKELAINVSKQVNSEEEISEKVFKGQVSKYNIRQNLTAGLIRCPELNQDFFFYDKDVKGSFTLNPSDIVNFQIATDQRKSYQRAINIIFLPETFIINSEAREKGYIASLKDNYGFIKCPNIEGSFIYFKFSELLDPTIVLRLNDEVEFTIITEAQNRFQAIRISIIPNGTIFNISKKPNAYENVQENFSLIHLGNNEIIDTQSKGIKLNGDNNSFSWREHLVDIFSEFSPLTNGGNNEFSNHTTNTNHNSLALTLNSTAEEMNEKTGVIIFLKDNYGFIESIDGENEYYFHITSFIEDNCKIGQSVKFNLLLLNGNMKAVNIIPTENIMKHENDLSEIFIGKVLRTIQMFDSEQNDYTGLIIKDNKSFHLSNGIDGGNNLENNKYEFSMISLKYIKDFISVGDSVRFQVATNCITKKKRAYNVELIRDRIRGNIVTLQKQYGFLKPDNLAMNVYFNSTEIRNDSAKIKCGDKVEFYLVKNKKIDKVYAIDINKVEEMNGSTLTMTDRTLFKSFNKSNGTGPKVIIIRQPKAPDGTRGFINHNK